MKHLSTLALCLAWLLAAFQAFALAGPVRWTAYYGSDKTLDFSPYQLVVLNRKHDMPVRQIKSPGRTVLAYISAGEAGPDQLDYPLLNERQLILTEPAHWPGNRLLNVRDPDWARYVVEELIPQILDEGFDGIMLDTLDTPLDAEKRDPERFAGMRAATVTLVKTIRAHYPGIPIMINRGFDILPQIAADVDFVLAESILVNYREGETRPSLFPDDTYSSLSAMLKDVRLRHPQLQILTLDYWPHDDREGIRHLYARHRAQGFIPYVGPFKLLDVTPEPQ